MDSFSNLGGELGDDKRDDPRDVATVQPSAGGGGEANIVLSALIKPVAGGAQSQSSLVAALKHSGLRGQSTGERGEGLVVRNIICREEGRAGALNKI